jgi:mono/diheme cytochrome c family protein
VRGGIPTFGEIRPLADEASGTAFAQRMATRFTYMPHILTSAFILAFLFATTGAAFAQSAAQIAQGEKVYAAQRCSICHSVAGKGNAKGPLDHVGSKLSADDIRLWMTDAEGMTAKTKAARKPFMKSYPKLEKADLDALVAYMQSLK